MTLGEIIGITLLPIIMIAILLMRKLVKQEQKEHRRKEALLEEFLRTQDTKNLEEFLSSKEMTKTSNRWRVKK